MSDDLVRRALLTTLKYCQNCLALGHAGERMQSRRVREIGVPEADAPRVVGDVSLPVGVRPAGLPDTEAEKRSAIERIYHRFFGRRRPDV